MMDIRNPRFTATTAIDCEIAHPELGWIPFTASAQDVEPHGGEIHAAALAQGPAKYTPPPEPTPAELLAGERAQMRLSFSQLLIGLVARGWITEAEGEAWLAGQLPQAVTDLISALPEQQRFAARARALRPAHIRRLDPLVIALAEAEGRTKEDLDGFFREFVEV
ncbi:MAG: hypothetical protein NXI27_30925 [Alphaproteobacteria bacterium]|nr:hypothetical protein [Alphaproteobacteria bacterium]